MLKTIVLAAGKGTRLQTEGVDLPKVMRLALGKPLLHYVLAALPEQDPKDVILVVGYKKDYITAAFPGYTFAEQTEQLGTGHAVMSAVPALGDYDGDVLVCCGDTPLVSPETYAALIGEHRAKGNVCTVLTGRTDDPASLGRVLRDDAGGFIRIVEARDCTPEQLAINEVNAGVYVFDAKKMTAALTELRTDNDQHEYYLTDLPDILLRHGERVGVCVRDMGVELIGVNTPDQLAQVEAVLRDR